MKRRPKLSFDESDEEGAVGKQKGSKWIEMGSVRRSKWQDPENPGWHAEAARQRGNGFGTSPKPRTGPSLWQFHAVWPYRLLPSVPP